MSKIRDQKFLYHLTPLRNFESILQRGLLSRAQVNSFYDVADPEIIESRLVLGLENFVPFHWFAGNPFDGRVQLNHPDDDFLLIAVHRNLAERENWRVVPQHPLANGPFELLDYRVGMETIDWDLMDLRDYHNPASKRVCMAECLSPRMIAAGEFARIFVPNEEVGAEVERLSRQARISPNVSINGGMFSR